MKKTLLNVAVASGLKETFGDLLIGFNNVVIQDNKVHMAVVYEGMGGEIIREGMHIKLKDLAKFTKRAIKNMTEEDLIDPDFLQTGTLEKEGEEQGD